MFAYRKIYPTIPVHDIQRAKQFYHDKLGLTPTRDMGDSVIYEHDGGSFFIYQTGYAGTAQHTLASFEVADLRAEVGNLRAKGVVFEEYDFPGLKTVDGIADLGSEFAAWFKDSEGNILAISQLK